MAIPTESATLESYCILLCYKYAVIEDAPALADWMKATCTQLGMCGRVIVSREGINVNVAALHMMETPSHAGESRSAVESFIEALRRLDPASLAQMDRTSSAPPACPFEDTDFKVDVVRCPSSSPPFGDLFVKCGKEIVSSTMPSSFVLGEQRCGGEHISPTKWDATIRESAAGDEELVLIDLRNSYEFAYGHFSGAIDSGCQYGVEEWSRGPGAKLAARLARPDGAPAPNARVMMYCTGGVRCEKASAFLRASGVTCPVQQLQGGIHRYLEQYGSSGAYVGSNFVFDGRPSSLQRPPGASVVAKCFDCGVLDETVSSDRCCAVCRTRIVVCGCCREKRRGIFFCVTHREHFDGIFFPFLDGFGSDALKAQRAALLALCVGALAGEACRGRRRAARKHIDRIDAALERHLPAMALRSGAGNAVAEEARGVGWRCRTCGRYLARVSDGSSEKMSATAAGGGGSQLCRGRCVWEHLETGYARLG